MWWKTAPDFREQAHCDRPSHWKELRMHRPCIGCWTRRTRNHSLQATHKRALHLISKESFSLQLSNVVDSTSSCGVLYTHILPVNLGREDAWVCSTQF